MDERAKIPVSLPCDNPTVSYWQDPPDAIADHRTTPDLPPTADTIVIGSGITGAAVAWNLLQGPNPGSILMLEARQACSGATGRNGGHTKAASYRSYAAHRSALGPRAAQQIARLELQGILALHSFAAAHAVPCDLRPGPTVDVVYDRAEWAAAVAAVETMRRDFGSGSGSGSAGDDVPPEAEYALYSRDEVLRRFRVHDSSFSSPSGDEEKEEKVEGGVGYFAGSLSAYKFAIGVLKLCLGKGLNLQTGTPVTELRRGERKGYLEEADNDPTSSSFLWEVRTARGTVMARRVVLATNGYTAAVWKPFQGVVVPLRGQIAAQRPGRSMPRDGCLGTTYSFIYKGGYEYMISRPEGSTFAGDIVIGGGLARAEHDGLVEFGVTDDSKLNEGISKYLSEATERYFGLDWGDDHPDGRVRSEWTGIMGFSPDGFPFVGEVPGERGLWTSCSFQGHGMVLCWMCARALVDMMEGRDNDELKKWFPDVFRITKERMAQRFQGRLDSIPMTERQ
ncbi:FAD dependent oxidoreductase [Corynascus novoguineensis]|uniref:FAD dependent oxidoreductase n=1 Tax=Corynascus novoguineensis TaxID=1126955 RepID=A0AAN7CUB6_9PEZI|nr:FAD dependent oxidoreductase [Corynascus novoguineensis]